jgi:hypothetical protein
VAGAPAQIVAGRHSPRGADHTLRYFELGS